MKLVQIARYLDLSFIHLLHHKLFPRGGRSFSKSPKVRGSDFFGGDTRDLGTMDSTGLDGSTPYQHTGEGPSWLTTRGFDSCNLGLLEDALPLKFYHYPEVDISKIKFNLLQAGCTPSYAMPTSVLTLVYPPPCHVLLAC